MYRYWVSFEDKDHRPVPGAYPADKYVAGYWCSGESATGNQIVCAALCCEDMARVHATLQKHWPTHGEIRFCEVKADDFDPTTGGRFQWGDHHNGWPEDKS